MSKSCKVERNQIPYKHNCMLSVCERPEVSARILLFPVDRDTYKIFYRLQSNVFDAASLFQTNHVVRWNAPRFCVASWLFHITWCSFTTCLSSRRKLTVVFVCHRTVSMTAAHQLKIRYHQDKFGAIFLDAFDTIKRAVSFPLEDKHVVNENHVIRKSHDARQKEMSSRGAFQCIMWLVWNKLAASKTLL